MPKERPLAEKRKEKKEVGNHNFQFSIFGVYFLFDILHTFPPLFNALFRFR